MAVDTLGCLAGLAAAVDPRPEDYRGDDGLLRCGRCGGRKQARYELSGQLFEPFCMCPCEVEAACAEEEQRQAREERSRLDALRASGIRDKMIADYRFENDAGDNPLMRKAHAYAKHWNQIFEGGHGLLLYGPVGTGKSFFAGCIANALLDAGVSVLMTNMPRILADLSDVQFKGRSSYLDSLDRFDLMIIDDLGAERSTEYAFEQVFAVIDGRYRTGKPLIVTTNISLRAMKDGQADLDIQRSYERILERCQPICFSGKNYRRHKADINKQILRDILNSPE